MPYFCKNFSVLPALKSVFAYILFFCFALRPVYNIGYVAYFELNIDYIIETYCVNKEKPQLQCKGKCHLAKQLSLNTADTEETNTLFTSFFEAFFPVYFQDYTLDFQTIKETVSIKNNWKYNNKLTSLFKECLYPPPQNYSLHT